MVFPLVRDLYTFIWLVKGTALSVHEVLYRETGKIVRQSSYVLLLISACIFSG